MRFAIRQGPHDHLLKRALAVENGALVVPVGAGLGVEVDEEKVRNASRG